MFENIVTSLGGRVAEQLVLEDISTGASSDLEQATKTARAMVTRYGFSERLGPVVYGGDPGETLPGPRLRPGQRLLRGDCIRESTTRSATSWMRPTRRPAVS